MIKARNILISPIRAVMYDIKDPTADFILCTSDERVTVKDGGNVILLRFVDTEEAGNPGSFSEQQAMRIEAFLERTDANEDLFICCDSGESRSSAIAAAITLAAGGSDMRIWESVEYHPNSLVFKIMCKKLGVFLAEEAIAERRERNRIAFHNTIHESGTKPQ